MKMTMIGWLHQLGTLEFWKALLEGFGGLGPIAPVILAMVESFFPPLPLIAIVALNVAAHGGLLGFAFFLEICPPLGQAAKGGAMGQPVRHRVPVHAVAPAFYALVLYALCLWHL